MTFSEDVRRDLDGMRENRPINPVFVLSNGTRIGMDLRYKGEQPCGEDKYWAVWQPVIEGEILKLMPMITSVDADEWPPAAALSFPVLSGIEANRQWLQRIVDNSPCLHGAYLHGRRVIGG